MALAVVAAACLTSAGSTVDDVTVGDTAVIAVDVIHVASTAAASVTVVIVTAVAAASVILVLLLQQPPPWPSG